jgi:hypothetical protein
MKTKGLSRIKINKRNTRGDIPVTLLVIGVFIVCALAMISFINADRNSEKTFIGVQIMEKVNIDIEKGNLEHHYVEDVRTVIVPDWSFNWVHKKLVFSMEYNP